MQIHVHHYLLKPASRVKKSRSKSFFLSLIIATAICGYVAHRPLMEILTHKNCLRKIVIILHFDISFTLQV